mmetsp:Transcript_9041/g.16293  ORF Transcript_9041/g.16293 Transcript_9041/m.16293 type:complete len:110 (+) Transcript_9041:359-688(+)
MLMLKMEELEYPYCCNAKIIRIAQLITTIRKKKEVVERDESASVREDRGVRGDRGVEDDFGDFRGDADAECDEFFLSRPIIPLRSATMDDSIPIHTATSTRASWIRVLV